MPSRRSPRPTLIIVTVLVAAYAALTWRVLTYFSGDVGIWLHEVSRSAAGEHPYRDFVWVYPPFSLAVYTAVARVFGTDLGVMWTTSTVVALLIYLAYTLWLRTVVDDALLTLAVTSAFLLSVAYSTIESETLAAGMWTPAAPLGALLLILLAWSGLEARRRPTAGLLAITGVLAGLLILTKQDYWPPVACVLVVAGQGAWREGRARGVAPLAAACAVVLAAGVAAVVVRAGPEYVTGALTGFGNSRVGAGRGFPSWERIVAQLALLAGFATVVGACLWSTGAVDRRRGRQLTIALMAATAIVSMIYVASSIGYGHGAAAAALVPDLRDNTAAAFARTPRGTVSAVRTAVGLFARTVRQQGWPLFFAPLALAWVVLRWKTFEDTRLRDLTVCLLLLVIAARARRLFEHVDWYHFLLEIPALTVWLSLVFPARPHATLRATRAFLVLLLVGGGALFADAVIGQTLGWRPWPSRGGPQRVETARGPLYLPPQDADAFNSVRALVDTIDPTGAAPLFSTRSQGSWNYFTGRPNPTPLTEGFALANTDPEKVFSQLLETNPKPIVVEVGSSGEIGRGFPSPTFRWNSWELLYERSPEAELNARFDQKLLTHYEPVGSVDGRIRTFTVYRWRDR